MLFAVDCITFMQNTPLENLRNFKLIAIYSTISDSIEHYYRLVKKVSCCSKVSGMM